MSAAADAARPGRPPVRTPPGDRRRTLGLGGYVTVAALAATVVAFAAARPTSATGADLLLAAFDVVVEVLLVVAGCGAVGVAVVLALLDGRTGPAGAAQRLRTAGVAWALLWALALLYGQPVLWVGGTDELLGAGGGALAAVGGALVLAVLVGRGTDRTSRLLVVGVALAAMNAHLVSVHAVHEGHHEGSVLGVAAISLHVAAVSVWFGGLLALALHLPREGRADAPLLERFSSIALVCYVLVALSGVLQVQDVLGLGGLLSGESYAVLLLVKIGVLVVAGVIGLVHRRATLPRVAAGSPAAFWRLVGVELGLMAVAAGVAATLGVVSPA